MRNKVAICIHERDSKHKIYVEFFSFPHTLTGAPPLNSAGGLLSPGPPQLCPQRLTPGDATAQHKTHNITKKFAIPRRLSSEQNL